MTKFASANLPDMGDIGNLVKYAVIGGTASAIGGGKFGNGAVTGAFQYLFNERVSELVASVRTGETRPQYMGPREASVDKGVFAATKDEIKEATGFDPDGPTTPMGEDRKDWLKWGLRQLTTTLVQEAIDTKLQVRYKYKYELWQTQEEVRETYSVYDDTKPHIKWQENYPRWVNVGPVNSVFIDKKIEGVRIFGGSF